MLSRKQAVQPLGGRRATSVARLAAVLAVAATATGLGGCSAADAPTAAPTPATPTPATPTPATPIEAASASVPADAATGFRYSLDLGQALTPTPQSQVYFGYLSVLKVADTDLSADLKLPAGALTPLSTAGGILPEVGALSSLEVGAQPTSPLALTAAVSGQTRQVIDQFLQSGSTRKDVTIQATIYVSNGTSQAIPVFATASGHTFSGDIQQVDGRGLLSVSSSPQEGTGGLFTLQLAMIPRPTTCASFTTSAAPNATPVAHQWGDGC